MGIDTIKQRILEEVDPEVRAKKRRQNIKNYLIVTAQFLFLIGLIIVLFYIMMGLSTVDGNSMYPTLHDKDVVVYERKVDDYRVGDVVVFTTAEGEEFVKRVVAVAGDTVNIQNGTVYVNGAEQVLNGPVGDTKRMDMSIENPYIVGDNEVYVLGDNRVNSEDSRMFGAVNIDHIKGRLVWYMGRL